MGESDRYIEYRKPQKRFSFTLGQSDNALVGLLTINIILFLLLMVIRATYAFFQLNNGSFEANMLIYFGLSANLNDLLYHPWTLISYCFTHHEVFSLISNSLWLYAFGYIFQEFTGNQKIIPLYIYGGVFGGIAFLVGANFFPPQVVAGSAQYFFGGNAANMAIAMAATTLAPNYRFFRNILGGIPIWVFMLIYILVDIAGISSGTAVMSFSHLTGAVVGFLFIYFLKNGTDFSTWMVNLYYWSINAFDPRKRNQQSQTREKIFYNGEGRAPYKKVSNITQQRVDQILDKISQKGYHHLTEEEKTILRRASEDDHF